MKRIIAILFFLNISSFSMERGEKPLQLAEQSATGFFKIQFLDQNHTVVHESTIPQKYLSLFPTLEAMQLSMPEEQQASSFPLPIEHVPLEAWKFIENNLEDLKNNRLIYVLNTINKPSPEKDSFIATLADAFNFLGSNLADDISSYLTSQANIYFNNPKAINTSLQKKNLYAFLKNPEKIIKNMYANYPNLPIEEFKIGLVNYIYSEKIHPIVQDTLKISRIIKTNQKISNAIFSHDKKKIALFLENQPKIIFLNTQDYSIITEITTNSPAHTGTFSYDGQTFFFANTQEIHTFNFTNQKHVIIMKTKEPVQQIAVNTDGTLILLVFKHTTQLGKFVILLMDQNLQRLTVQSLPLSKFIFYTPRNLLALFQFNNLVALSYDNSSTKFSSSLIKENTSLFALNPSYTKLTTFTWKSFERGIFTFHAPSPLDTSKFIKSREIDFIPKSSYYNNNTRLFLTFSNEDIAVLCIQQLQSPYDYYLHYVPHFQTLNLKSNNPIIAFMAQDKNAHIVFSNGDIHIFDFNQYLSVEQSYFTAAVTRYYKDEKKRYGIKPSSALYTIWASFSKAQQEMLEPYVIIEDKQPPLKKQKIESTSQLPTGAEGKEEEKD